MFYWNSQYFKRYRIKNEKNAQPKLRVVDQCPCQSNDIRTTIDDSKMSQTNQPSSHSESTNALPLFSGLLSVVEYDLAVHFQIARQVGLLIGFLAIENLMLIFDKESKYCQTLTSSPACSLSGADGLVSS